MSATVLTYKCKQCGHIVCVKKGEDAPRKCKATIKSRAFKSGSMKCGGLMVKAGEFEDKKVLA